MSYSRLGSVGGATVAVYHGGEGVADVVAVVAEVEHERAILAVVDAVEPGQGLHGGEPAERLVDVHRVQQRLVEAGLVFLRDDEDLPVVSCELLGGLRLREAVHVRLGPVLHPGQHRAGERDEHPDVIAVFAAVAGERLLVADGVQPGGGGHHRLGPAVDLVAYVAAEVLDDDLGLLREVVLVQADELRDRGLGLRRVVRRVVANGLFDVPVRLIGDVVGEHVEDEAFLDGLAHRVQVERLVLAGGGVEPPELLQHPALWRRGEGEEADVALLPPRLGPG